MEDKDKKKEEKDKKVEEKEEEEKVEEKDERIEEKIEEKDEKIYEKIEEIGEIEEIDEKDEKIKEENEKNEKIEEKEIVFLDIIFFFSTLALQGLGEIGVQDLDKKNATKKIQDLNLAKHNIDIIAKLKEKTKGNLTQTEEKIIDNILYNLRMKYIETISDNNNK